jgi:hypothetical protein
MSFYPKEKYEVMDDCPECGASSKKIEKYLYSDEDYKKPSRDNILKRMKEAGLPTRV